MRVSLGAKIKLPYYDPKVMGLKHENNLSVYKGKAAYISPSLDPALAGASCTALPFFGPFCFFLVIHIFFPSLFICSCNYILMLGRYCLLLYFLPKYMHICVCACACALKEWVILQAMLIAAESKREEEKAKGVSTDDATDNPDIVLFEDNEEEEEEESEEEDESSGQGAQGRGRGRGMMWQPHMPLGRGGRPMHGVRGFPPVMMGADGFGYGDCFAAPDPFGIPPRVFAPFGGPRFSGDFSGTGPMSGLVFPGRPPQPGAVFPMGGLGMMMGPCRAPFMGGMPMGGAGRPNRPMGVSPFLHPPPPPPNSRAVKRDQRRPASDRSDRHDPGSDQGSKGQEMTGPSNGVDGDMAYHHGAKVQPEDKFVAGDSFQNDDSESEDEAAPRRSRHGEGKRKRRVSEGEPAPDR